MHKEQWKNNKLKELRKARNLTQKDIARLIDHKGAERICHWERGEALPSVPNLFKLAMLFKVFPHEIYPSLFE
jgi:transcriptional regulator with XRE-family HTH domain